ncbi:anaerobic ribonucleoside-triphosphate reductase activating protein [Methanogenium sp. S4BF]|uniref:anaerobic ribonucleoside-triphosphate reductase activating protein n=1 Tax=Methanogenium sp. S4BF TaxID=1789226 RepID=UPI0024170C96|nr:anaerobic ribonucleoside-triphosphate reductase activating protein [Methanogenium sp. S4BF]WFN34876.1 anaerobic ribonucleoside-triphosphate reductase activating protein [Methanogenium sp. S4BF]
MNINFGGFVPISTVDWRGRSVCTVFLRGCPVHCHYCHNPELQGGADLRTAEEILDLIQSSRMLISGVIFSGGEPTMQKDALIALAEGCRAMGLKVGVQTNGVFPETLEELVSRSLIDLVHLDLKTRWEHYPKLLKVKPEVTAKVQRSLAFCREAYQKGTLSEFQVVVTLFPGREDDVAYISREVPDVDFVLNQGVSGELTPLSFNELKGLADKIQRPVRIRTREDGEVTYKNGQIIIADSIVLTDILQARRKY